MGRFSHFPEPNGWPRGPRAPNALNYENAGPQSPPIPMVEVCEGAPVAVSGWVLADGHDLAPCAANGLHRVTTSVNDVIGGMGTLGMA